MLISLLKKVRFQIVAFAAAVAVLLLGLYLGGGKRAYADPQKETPVDTVSVRAPELAPNLGWLNTTGPLTLKSDLKGQVVLLDFWTYCCINCMQILPDLEYLEKKYAGQPFTVVGVHSAKFENESDRDMIAAAIKRYKIHHPVVVDDDMQIWQRYTVSSWPTFVLIDSRGYLVGQISGEGNRQILDDAIGKALAEGRANGSLAAKPIPAMVAKDTSTTSVLAFPGKVLADEKSGRLFIADSNHNRILISKLPSQNGDAKIIATVGSGKSGLKDGSFAGAEFQNPQGLSLQGEKLYVADTNNHAVRAIDLATSTVTTIAGNGKQSYDRKGGLVGTKQGIASPWDVYADGKYLLIAMAGTHQLWRMDLESGVVANWSGTGRENIVDGPAASANFAQPSGITKIADNYYIADSEVSGIRTVNVSNGEVKTVVGKGLFVFGDEDGSGDTIRLQHPLGVANYHGKLLVADTYNHKIKLIDPATRTARTLYGTGSPGDKTTDGKIRFFEPAGLSAAGDNIFVADTNNHRIVMINGKTGDWKRVNFIH